MAASHGAGSASAQAGSARVSQARDPHAAFRAGAHAVTLSLIQSSSSRSRSWLSARSSVAASA
ncbi:MAG: hypothetical protein MUC68_16320, partial [Burkholderiaceae bacterium]|nr:hypothetical protein [Burkholderiaceae bacterium]